MRKGVKKKLLLYYMALFFSTKENNEFMIKPKDKFMIKPKDKFMIKPKDKFMIKPKDKFMIKPKDIIEAFLKRTGINLEELYKSILNILKKLDDSTLIKLETKINGPNIKGGKKRKTRKSKRKTRKSKRKTRKYGGNKNKSIIVPVDNNDNDNNHVIDIEPINENVGEQTCCICFEIMRGINNSNNNDNNNNDNNNNDNNNNDNIDTISISINDDDNNDNEQLQSLDIYTHTYTTPDGTQYSHYVHEVCLNDWIESLIQQGRTDRPCPICREELPSEHVNNILNKYRDNRPRSNIIRVLLAIIYLILNCMSTLTGLGLIALIIYSSQPTGGSNTMEKEQQQKNLLKLFEILNELIKHNKGTSDTSDTSEIEKLIDLIKQKMPQN